MYLLIPENISKYVRNLIKRDLQKQFIYQKHAFHDLSSLPASTKEPLEDLIRKFDWIVFTNNKYENELTSSEIAWIGNIKPTLKIYKPKFKQKIELSKKWQFPSWRLGRLAKYSNLFKKVIFT